MTIGIDVSYAQGKPDWTKVKATDKVRFVYVKASGGLAVKGPDISFEYNWRSLKELGIPRGAYHFFQATADASAQADAFYRVVGKLDNEDLPPMLDVEVDRPNNMSGAQFARNVRTFIERAEKLFERRIIIYTGGPIFDKETYGATEDDASFIAKHYLWLAAYVTNPDKYVPMIWKSRNRSWTLWQKSGDTGPNGTPGFRINGINSVVDLDVTQGIADDIEEFVKSSVIDTEEPTIIPMPEEDSPAVPTVPDIVVPDIQQPVIVDNADSQSGLWGIITLIFRFITSLFRRG
jgi:lysozyme